MFIGTVSNVASGSVFVSPLIKKEKIRDSEKISPRDEVKQASAPNRTKIKDLFSEDESTMELSTIYDDDSQSKFMTDYIFMGKYYDDLT
jgi:hypothetical protein